MLLQILCIAVAVILLCWASTDIMLQQDDKKYFLWSVFLIITVVLAELGCTFFDNTTPENRIWSILFNLIGFGLSPFVLLCESLYFSKKSIRRLCIPALINLFMVILSPVTGWIFFVTPACEYQRGPLFFVYLLSFGFSLLVSILQKLASSKHYPTYFRDRILCSGIILLGAVLIQVIFPTYHTTWLSICVYFVLQYALICEISSMVDGLTGLLNKTVFSRQMQYLTVTKHSEMYLLMIDVNDFKLVNDKMGHLYGDKCLVEIADILKQSFGPASFIYRFGGDEFCVFLNAATEAQVEQYILHLDALFAEKQAFNKDFPSIAVGREKFRTKVDIQTTIDLADEHMYENKRKMKVPS